MEKFPVAPDFLSDDDKEDNYLSFLEWKANDDLEFRDFEGEPIRPFQISRGRYAIEENGDILIAEPGRSDEIWQAVKEIERHQDRLAFFKSEKGRELVAFIEGCCRPLELNDLVLRRVDRASSNKQEDLRDLSDFKFLCSTPAAMEIESEFGLPLSSLSLREQFYFLRFVKTKSFEEIESIKRFSRKFGISGLRTFLSLDYGQDIGDQIINLGEKNELEARNIFEAYGGLINSAGVMWNKISNSRMVREADLSKEIKNDLPGEIYEAILRRSKDLLVAAHTISSQESKDFSLKDVAIVIRSLEVFFSILSREEDYRFIEESSQSENHFNFEIWDERYNPDMKYKLRIFIRPGVERNAQARVNFELDFNTTSPHEEFRRAFEQKTNYKTKKKTVEESVLRIAIDREEINGEEKVSLDFGRSARSSAEFDRTGDKLGNLLALVDGAGHHTFESFPKEYASKENFKTITEIFRKYMKGRD